MFPPAIWIHLFIVAGLFILGGVVARVWAPRIRDPIGTTSIVLLLGGTTLAAATAVAWSVMSSHWGFLLAAIPSALVIRHAVYLRLVRRGGGSLDPELITGDMGSVADPARLRRAFARARAAHEREFNGDVLVIRYGIPALVIFLVGAATFEVLVHHQCCIFPPELAGFNLPAAAQRGARYASAGAFVYVLIYLGQRSMRRDLTSAAATWAAVTFALGPILGGVVALLWKGGATGAEAQTSWSEAGIYFVAGLAPKSVANVVEEAVRRLWLSRDESARQPPRIAPLTQLRGITVEIEDRLSEEGIDDAYAMAMADPLRLYRSTAFDKRQLLAWIDEALLMVWCPKHWEALQDAGISGAIDLAARSGRGTADLSSIGIADLTVTARTLAEDAQVALIWALYQLDGDGGDDDEDADAVPAPAPVRPFLRVPAIAPATESGRSFHDWTAAAGGVLLVLAGAATVSYYVPQFPWGSATMAAPVVAAALCIWLLSLVSRSHSYLVTASIAVLGMVAVGVLAWLLTPPRELVFPTFLWLCAALIATLLAEAVYRRLPLIEVTVKVDGPGDAVVYIDGAAAKKGPDKTYVGRAARGMVYANARAAGYADCGRWIDSQATTPTELKLEPPILTISLKPAEVSATITYAPSDSPDTKKALLIGDNSLIAGSYIIVATAEGYKSQSEIVRLTPDRSRKVEFVLVPDLIEIVFEVPAQASNPSFILDGVAQTSPTAFVLPGSHSVSATWQDSNGQPRKRDEKITIHGPGPHRIPM